MPPQSLTNLETQKYCQNKTKFKDVYSRNNLPKINNGTYVKSLNKCKLIRTHWIASYENGNIVTYFDSFGVEHIPKEIENSIRNMNVITNIYRIQAYNSVMCGYFFIGFVDFMLKGKSFLDYINLFFLTNMKTVIK